MIMIPIQVPMLSGAGGGMTPDSNEPGGWLDALIRILVFAGMLWLLWKVCTMR